MHCQPAYYNGSSDEFVFIWSENDNLRAYPFNRNTNLLDVSHMAFSSLSGPKGQSGAVLSVSSNGGKDGTGIYGRLMLQVEMPSMMLVPVYYVLLMQTTSRKNFE